MVAENELRINVRELGTRLDYAALRAAMLVGLDLTIIWLRLVDAEIGAVLRWDAWFVPCGTSRHHL